MVPIKEYLEVIKPYLKDINNLEKSDTWKIFKIAIVINFSFSKDTDEECVMHSNSDNIKIMFQNKEEFYERTF